MGIEKEALEMFDGDLMDELDEEFEQDGYDIEEFEDDKYKGIQATKSFERINEVDFEEGSTEKSPFDFQIEKTFLSKKYKFTGNAEAIGLDMLEEAGQLAGNSLEFTFTVVMPEKPKKHNATEVNGNTLIWDLSDDFDEDMYAEASGINWIIYVVGAFIIIIAIIFLLRRKQTKTTDQS